MSNTSYGIVKLIFLAFLALVLAGDLSLAVAMTQELLK
jgi:hypothetical protein